MASPRCFVLDTDIGWDPDDILAVALLLLGADPADRLAIISSDEPPSRPHSRAGVVQATVSAVGRPDVLVAAGGPRPAYVARERRGHLEDDEPLFAEGLESTLAPPPDAAGWPTLADVAAFMARARADGMEVIWVGIGALTNLAALLTNSDYGSALPHHILQQGGTFYRPGFNFRLDPRGAAESLAAAERLGVPITFVTSETTGSHPAMTWVQEGRRPSDSAASRIRGESGPWAARATPLPDFFSALSPLPGVLSLIEANIGPGGYSGCSAMHDPLTVLHALALPPAGSPAEAFSRGPYFDTACARLRVDAAECERRKCRSSPCASGGMWRGIQVSPAAIAVAEGGDRTPLQQVWWRESLGLLVELPDGDQGNCCLSFGPASDKQMTKFWEDLAAILRRTDADSIIAP